MTGVEPKRPLEEADRCRRSLIGEHLDIGQPREVIDGDVHALPPDLLACNTLGVGPGGCPTLAAPGDPLARPALDAPELLDVDAVSYTHLTLPTNREV